MIPETRPAIGYYWFNPLDGKDYQVVGFSDLNQNDLVILRHDSYDQGIYKLVLLRTFLTDYHPAF
jgi:hypothetical protein